MDKSYDIAHCYFISKLVMGHSLLLYSYCIVYCFAFIRLEPCDPTRGNYDAELISAKGNSSATTYSVVSFALYVRIHYQLKTYHDFMKVFLEILFCIR